MVLLEIHAQGISRVEFERDAPWSIDVNRIAHRPAAQHMKIEPGDVHIIWTAGAIERVEPAKATLV